MRGVLRTFAPGVDDAAALLTPVVMPRWGVTMDEGIVAAWRVREGDVVEAGDELAVVETSKLSNAVEAPVSGTVLRLFCHRGGWMRVGALLALLGPPDADADEVEALVERHQERAARTDADIAPHVGVTAGPKAIAYSESGVGGPPVVLLHGFGGDRDTWALNAGALANGRRTIALDLPGHGDSTKAVQRGDLAELAGDVAAALDQLGVPRALFVGHGLGAGVALELARTDPARVLGIAALGGFGADAGSRAFAHGFLQAEGCEAIAPMVRRLFGDPRKVCRRMVEDMLRLKRTEGAQPALEAIAAAVLTREVEAGQRRGLADAAVPILALLGDLDRMVAPGDVPSNISARLIRGAGHMAHLEAADQINQLVATFAAETADG